MSLTTFKDDLSSEISAILSSGFEINVTETKTVPKANDPAITFPNVENSQQSCKLIETCVLYIDIRKSTELNLTHRRATVARLYSAFGRAMTRAARYYGGHVRGIIGDRLMVVFDVEDCHTKAVDTAILMNSVAKHVINKNFKNNEVKCGIGIDFGKMLITKVGIIRRGHEAGNYQGLVWLGRPANVASKLTDVANKPAQTYSEDCVHVGRYYPLTAVWNWQDQSFEGFLDDLENNILTNTFKHKDEYYRTHFKTIRSRVKVASTPPILMTNEVYSGYKRANPNSDVIKKNWLTKRSVSVNEYNGQVFGGDLVKTAFTD